MPVRRPLRAPALLLLAFCGLPAAAAVPDAVDFAPEGAQGFLAIKNVAAFSDKLNKSAEFLPPDMVQGLAHMQLVMAMPGVNPQGSLVLIPSPDAAAPAEGNAQGQAEGESAEEDKFIVIVPIKDHAAFTQAAGATTNGDVAKIATPDGQTVFAKALGDGYSAFSADEASVSAFKPARGSKARVEKDLGVVGNRVSDASDLVLVGDIEKLAPAIRKQANEAKMQGQFAMMMAGGAGGNDMFAAMDQLTEAFIRDARVAIVGLNLGDTGIAVDVAACFKEGTEAAKMLSSKGNSAQLASRLPNQPYLFAMAADTSIPAVKDAMKSFLAQLDAQPKPAGEAADAEGFGAMRLLVDSAFKSDGVAFQVGFAPGGINTGLLAASVLYTQSKAAKDQLAAFKGMVESVSGKTVEGTTFTSEWKPAATDVNGAKVDSWAVAMEMNPDDPNFFQAQQIQMVMYGSPPTTTGSPKGYAAATDNGLVVTMSQSSKLMGAALDAAKNANGMGAEELTKSVSDKLPENRTFEMYLGAKSIMDTAAGVARMFGQDLQFQLPPKIAPVGMAATTDNAGVQMRLYVPHDVIRAVRDVMQNMEPPAAEGAGAPAQKSRGPRS